MNVSIKRLIDHKIITLLCRPVLRRIGTAFAGYLVASGVDAGLVEQLLIAIAATLAIGVDLAASALAKKETEAAARRSVFVEVGFIQPEERG